MCAAPGVFPQNRLRRRWDLLVIYLFFNWCAGARRKKCCSMNTMSSEDVHMGTRCKHFNDEFMELETFTHRRLKDEATSVYILSNPKLRSPMRSG